MRCKQIICRNAALAALDSEKQIDQDDLMDDETREAVTDCMDHFAHDMMKILMESDD